jgi:regulator of sigma E protease
LLDNNLFNILLSIFSFVVVLSIVVFVHEFGHFQVAKWLGVKIDKFSLGFGPKVLGWTDKEGVEWRIGAYPLGGFVQFAGDKDGSSFPDESYAAADNADDNQKGHFHNMPVWVRSLVAAAGPFSNFLFSIFVFAVLLFSYGEIVHKPVIEQVMPDGAAYKAGILVGDEVLTINGNKLDSIQDLQRTIITSGGENLKFEILRNSQHLFINVVPQVVARETPFGDKETQGAIGIGLTNNPKYSYTIKYNPITAIQKATEKTYQIIDTQVKFIGALFRGAMSFGHLSGPLGIGQSAGMVAKNSIDSVGQDAGALLKIEALALGLIQLACVLSVAIGFMNLLPLPILDGGHLVFYALEALRGKPVSQSVQLASYKVGFACLMILFVFATFQDIERTGIFRGIHSVTGMG